MNKVLLMYENIVIDSLSDQFFTPPVSLEDFDEVYKDKDDLYMMMDHEINRFIVQTKNHAGQWENFRFYNNHDFAMMARMEQEKHYNKEARILAASDNLEK